MTSAALALPLAAVLLAVAEHRSRRQLRAMAQAPGSLRRLLPDLALIAALALLLWPAHAPPAAPPGADPALALAVDVSASMAAGDLPGNRLQRSRHEIGRLLDGLPQARFALIPFAGEAVLQVPLTGDREALRFFAERLEPGAVSAPGSAPEEAVLAALQALSAVAGERAVVLFSDGERTAPETPPPLPAGTPVHVVALGDGAGAPLPDESGAPRRGPNGKPLRTVPDRERLERIAAATGGQLLADVTPLLARWSAATPAAHPTARAPVAGAIFFLALRHLPFRRRRARTLAALGLALVLLPLAACNPDNAVEGLARFAAAEALHRTGDDAAAAERFAEAADALEGPERAAALYNRGTLLLATGDPLGALPCLEKALLLDPGDEAVRTNLVLALRRLGEHRPPGASDGDARRDGEEKAMNRQEALQLLESVRPDAAAPRAASMTARSTPLERDW